ncbi:MAG: ABC transporter permease [Desulfamplus sp.]|nr:ABC transporter permease [Desulfamplus sp.]
MGELIYELGEGISGGGVLTVAMTGEFTMDADFPTSREVVRRIDSFGVSIECVLFKSRDIARWDSSILTFLKDVTGHCSSRGIAWDVASMPGGIQRLLDLASAVPEREGIRKKTGDASFLSSTGQAAMDIFHGTLEMLGFIGDAFIAFLRLILGRYKIRMKMFFPIVRECSVDALPIVSLISCLVGLILAFVGAVQLVMFGAQIYVASLVGIAMIRVMGAVMVGVIMAGRTGAAFAAQLGTMEVNEEIDALKTLGISPMEFLVMPRILALAFVMPLLCLYADLMGIMGGMAVGIFMLDLNFMEYYNMTKASVNLNSFWIGIFQSFVFGILVALAGCLRGMQCRRNASAVGEAATSAVVTGIVAIVIATAVITVVCNVLGI